MVKYIGGKEMWSRKKRDVTDVLQGASWYPMLSLFKQQEKAVAVVLCCIGLVDLDKPLPSSLTWGDGRDKALGSKYISYMPRKENVMRLWFQKKKKTKKTWHYTSAMVEADWRSWYVTWDDFTKANHSIKAYPIHKTA